MDEARPKAWAGVDAGKEFHWAHVLDASGEKLFSRKVTNDESDLSALIDEALSFAEEVVWAIDQPGGGATLLLGLLWKRGHRVLYMPGLTVDRSRDTYPGESKTDARDAHVIADQARMRPNLEELTAGEGELAELQLLLARRRDLVTDQTRSINRLRDTLLSSFPTLERALNLTNRGALILVSNYQTPAAIRRMGRMGRKRLAAFLANRSIKGPMLSLARPLPRPSPRALGCPPKRSVPALLPNSRQRCLPSSKASRPSTGSLENVFSPVLKQRSSLASQEWE